MGDPVAGLQQEIPVGDSAAGDPEAGVPGSSGTSHLILRTELGKLLILSLAVTVCCCEVWCGFSLLAPSLSKETTQGERQRLESRT